MNKYIRTVCILILLTAGMIPAVSSSVRAEESTPTLHQKIGQMLLVGFRGLAASDATPEMRAILRDVGQLNLGGVILFDYDVSLKKNDRNIHDRAQVRALVAGLQHAAKTPLFIAIDQEGGKVARLKPQYGFAATPSAEELGNGTLEATRAAGDTVGAMLSDVGINWDYAPVLDVNVNPECPVIGKLGRSFSADPDTVAAHGRAFAEGLNGHGVIACLKHFPGHGSATADSHLGVTDITSTWTPGELIPFEKVLRAPLRTAVMTGHLFNARLDAENPATLSRSTITGLLREKMGYEGVIITDDMQMKAVADAYGLDVAVERAINAGADILLFGNNLSYDPEITPKVIRIISRLVDSNRISALRIEQSYRRIMKLKQSLGR